MNLLIVMIIAVIGFVVLMGLVMAIGAWRHIHNVKFHLRDGQVFVSSKFIPDEVIAKDWERHQ